MEVWSDCQHGGDIFSLKQPVLDFSINLNPMGMPPCAVEAACRCLEAPPRYPDPHCRSLRQVISRRDGVKEEHILCGNGASDLIDRLVRAIKPKCALVTAPTFSEYEKFLKINSCKVDYHFTLETENFCFNPSILSRITPETDMVFLCDPNNPNGTLIDLSLLTAILERCRQTHTLLVLDQCFLELTCAPADRMVHELEKGGLVLLRALTKSYAMAGLRIGYCLSAQSGLLEKMAAIGQPWAVSVPAQAAAEAALSQAPDWPAQCLRELEQQRGRLTAALTAAGAAVFPSDSNFLLFRWKDGTLKDSLLRQGILIRQCSDYRGLGPRYFRLAVRSAQDNSRLICALDNLKEG